MADDLKGIIRRRKAVDWIFGLAGAALVVSSLGILAWLMGSLVQDGTGPLTQTIESRADGSSFGRRDVLATVENRNGQWFAVLDPLTIGGEPRALAKLKPFEGRQVALTGAFARPPRTTFELESIVDPAGADLIGTLRGQVLTPIPLQLRPGEGVVLRAGRFGLTGRRDFAGGTMKVSAVADLSSKTFFDSFPSRFPEEAGILSAWVGTLMLMVVTMLTAVPVGVAAGVYLEEYAPKNKLTDLIEINIANLAGVPSIIWGLMALGLFVYQFGFGRSVLTGGMTLGLLVLPIVIIATREAIRAIPGTIREASVGLGATKWQTIRHHVLPYSMSGILTGSIIALSRAIGETAPLITIGALTYIAFLPPSPVGGEFPWLNFRWLTSEFSVLPIQLFNWVSRPDRRFHENAAAAGIVLAAMTLSLNGIAIYLRYRLRKGIKW